MLFSQTFAGNSLEEYPDRGISTLSDNAQPHIFSREELAISKRSSKSVVDSSIYDESKQAYR